MGYAATVCTQEQRPLDAVRCCPVVFVSFGALAVALFAFRAQIQNQRREQAAEIDATPSGFEKPTDDEPAPRQRFDIKNGGKADAREVSILSYYVWEMCPKIIRISTSLTPETGVMIGAPLLARTLIHGGARDKRGQ